MSTTTQRKLWEGKLPTCFSIAEHEMAGACSEVPPPLYRLVSRVSYLTLLNQEIIEHFSCCINAEKTEEIWYECNGKPLHWNYPTGVLFDMHCDAAKDLPWCITVHFQSFPKDKLLSCSCEDDIQANFLSTLKEADFLKHSGNVVTNMSKDQHMQLWHGLKTHNFELFWGMNKKFMDANRGSTVFQSIPIRVYFENRVLQTRMSSENEETGELTLIKSLQLIDGDEFDDTKLNNFKVILQGVSPPLQSNLQWLSENLSYPDNFIHICVKKCS